MAEEVEKAVQEEQKKEPEVAESTGEEDKKTDSGKRRKEKKQYSADDFKHPQPRIKKQPFQIVYRSRKWFNKQHLLEEFKRDDPHKEERERLQPARKAAVERGEEIAVKTRKQPRGVQVVWGVHSMICTTLNASQGLVDVTTTRTLGTRRIQ